MANEVPTLLPPDASGGGGSRPPSTRIETPEHFIMIVALVALTAAICWGVLSRYVVSTPAAWAEEVSSTAFAWLIFVGAAEVHRRRQNICVDIVTTLLPPWMQRLIAVAMELVLIAFCLYAAWLGALQALASRGSFTSILRLPLWINTLALSVGFALMAFRSAQYLWREARGSRTR